jgi:hypothetical protein
MYLGWVYLLFGDEKDKTPRRSFSNEFFFRRAHGADSEAEVGAALAAALPKRRNSSIKPTRGRYFHSITFIQRLSTTYGDLLASLHSLLHTLLN